MSSIDKLFDVRGRVVAITGGGGLLCGTMARALGSMGCHVMILDRTEEAASQVTNDIQHNGGSASYCAIDVTKKNDWQEALKKILDRYGRVDILINGAGINAPTPLLEIREAEWDAILAVHVKGTLFGCQVFGGQMFKQGKGSIINISSASSGPPLSKAFAYSVAKAGIKNLTQNIAREWATKGVRVNALRPGFFPTEWNRKNFITPERGAAILGHTPMGRYGEPEELVGAVIWLASDAASFVTGAEIAVDGGFSCMTI
ncbi:SDR family oxidoreductase [Candidatus Uhrbacteria bacterium]|nr:SDR family oxidoreductase [Candidatus Uhrbacteria bacterium]